MVASRTVLVRIRADADQFNREVVTSTGSMRKLGDESDKTSSSIDRLSGRVRLLGEVGGSLGPGLVPVLGATAQATAGLATQVGFAVLAAGSAVIAFQGMGDALKALSDARIEPTTANLAKAEAAMARLSPAGQDLARTISGLSDEWERTKAIAQGGLFPGVDAAIDSMMTRLPELQHILATVSTTAGDLLAEGADSLASDRWDAFFTYLDTSAKPILVDTAHTAGDLTHALSELIIAMDPLTRDFTGGLAAAADDFDKWATGLSATQGFQDFVAYMRVEGPHVAETVGDIAGALAAVVEATAGAGSISLDFLQIIATTVRTIADSPVGPTLIQLIQLVSTMALLNRAWTLFSTSGVATFKQGQVQAVEALTTTISAQQRATMTTAELTQAQAKLNAQQRAAVGTLARGAAGVAGMGLAALDAQHHMAGLSTASGALMGFAVGGPWGAALGGAIGLLGDLAQKQQAAATATDAFTTSLNQQTGAATDATKSEVLKQIGDDWLSYAEKAGISATQVADAVVAGGDELDKLQAKVREAAGSSWDPFNSDAWTNDANDFNKLLDSTRGKLDAGSRGFERHKELVGDTGDAYANATPKVKGFTSALQELNTWLDKRAAFRDYKQSIEDANAVLKDNKSTHREVAAALDDVARKAGVVAEGMNKADRQKFLSQALKDLRDMKGQGDVADGVIQKLLARLRELNGTTAKTYIDVIRRTSGGGTASTPGFGPQAKADGGLIRGPGTKTSDSIDLRASDGEYMQRAAAVDYYGVAFMDAVNDLRFPKHAPAVQPFTHGGGSGGGLDASSIVAALVVTNERLTELQRAVEVRGPRATGRAVVEKLNEGMASEMRAAEL